MIIKPSSHRAGLETLPTEVFNLIGSFLSQTDVTVLCRLSRKCHALAIPYLFRTLDIEVGKFTEFLQLWQDGGIPAEYFQHVRRFTIRGHMHSPEDIQDYNHSYWKMLLDLIKSGVMTGLVTVVVDGQSPLGFQKYLRALNPALDNLEKVMRNISAHLPQNVFLQILTGSQGLRELHAPSGIVKFLTNTHPVVCLHSYSEWDSSSAWTMLFRSHPDVFNDHLQTLKITFGIPRFDVVVARKKGMDDTSRKLTELLIIPDSLKRLHQLMLIHPRDFSSLPPNLTTFCWVMTKAQKPVKLTPYRSPFYYVHAWEAIARLKHLRRLEIQGSVDASLFAQYPVTLISSVEFNGLEELIVAWAIGRRYRPDFYAIRNVPELTTIQSLVNSVIEANRGIKRAKISGLSGLALRQLAHHGQLEMLNILERAPYYNGLIDPIFNIQDDDIESLTNCPRLHYLRVGRPIPRQILQQLVTACQFQAPLNRKLNFRNHGIFVHIGTPWEFGNEDSSVLQLMHNWPLQGYLLNSELRERLQLEGCWKEVPKMGGLGSGEGDEIGGIIGEQDDYADYHMVEEVMLNWIDE